MLNAACLRNDKQEALYKSYLDSPPTPVEDLRRCDDFKRNKSWIDKRIQKRRREVETESEEAATKKLCTTPPSNETV